MTARRAFSHVDLLVTIGVLVVLAGLLLPLLESRRHIARTKHSCISNLKQIGTGLAFYATNHGQQFPVQGPMGGHNTSGDALVNPAHAVGLYDGGDGEIPDPRVFVCPSSGEAAPPGRIQCSYQRSGGLVAPDGSGGWAPTYRAARPNVIVVGDQVTRNAAGAIDHRSETNHGGRYAEAFCVLFKDGHVIIHPGDGRPIDAGLSVNGVKGAAQASDNLYGDGEATATGAAPSSAEWTHLRYND